MIKKIISGLISVLALLVLAGCQPAAPAESVIKEELSLVAGQYIGEAVEVTHVEIEKRLTDESMDISYCNVSAEGEIASYNMYFRIEYRYYDKGGWLVEKLSIDRQDEWTAIYNDDNLKTVDDVEKENDKIYITGLDKEVMEFSWNSMGTFLENGKYVQNFFGSASYSNEICNISVPVFFYYIFETCWVDETFCAYWEGKYEPGRGNISDYMELDMSGVWVGNTIKENTGSDVSEYVDRSKYTGEMKLTLTVDENGYPSGKLETVVPYIDVFWYWDYMSNIDKSVDLGCNDLSYRRGTWNDWYTDFELYGKGNENLRNYGIGEDNVQLHSLTLDPINKTLSGKYSRTYGTSFDVELKWIGKE